MWLVKDFFVVPKSKGDFFWKGFLIGCIIGMGVTLLIYMNN